MPKAHIPNMWEQICSTARGRAIYVSDKSVLKQARAFSLRFGPFGKVFPFKEFHHRVADGKTAHIRGLSP